MIEVMAAGSFSLFLRKNQPLFDNCKFLPEASCPSDLRHSN